MGKSKSFLLYIVFSGELYDIPFALMFESRDMIGAIVRDKIFIVPYETI